MTHADRAQAIVEDCERLYSDVELSSVRRWKQEHPGRAAVGHLPVYVPRELIDAAGGLAVAMLGGGDQVDIVRGDACFQSYICHLPRSTIELGLTGAYDVLDAVLFPSTCDVIRNLSGIWQLQFPQTLVRYVDLPQSMALGIADRAYRDDLENLAAELGQLSGRKVTRRRLAGAIERRNANRRALAALYDARAQRPWLFPTDECFLVARAGALLPVAEHTALIERYLAAASERRTRPEDRVRVVVAGSFCEQPPLALLRALERSGCYVVDDDLNLFARWIEGDVRPGDDPLGALATAYLTQSHCVSTRYETRRARGEDLVDKVMARRADGVVFAAPSFCDPALLDQPPLLGALAKAKIPSIAFKYAENTGQFQSIREQAGTFADSIKLWGQ